MSVNIDSILNNMTNENIEINCRAVQSLHNKIANKLISLDHLSEVTCDKCLVAFGKWFSMYLNYKEQHKYEEDFISKILIDFSNCIEKFPIGSIKALKTTMKVSNLINDIGTAEGKYRDICDRILQLLAKTGTTDGLGVAQSQGQPHMSNLTNSNMGSVSLSYSITRQDEVQSVLKGSSSRISKGNSTVNGNGNGNGNSGSNHPTFNKCIVTSNEEQMLFDLGINLKFGDALQLYKSFYILYSQVINDFPIEFIMQNEEMLRAFFNIVTNCNFLEFGVICYKILDKLFTLLEKKINLCLNDYSSLTPTTTTPQSQLRDVTIIEDTCFNTIESFLFNSITALTKAIVLDVNKLAFYVSLIEKNFNLLQRLVLNRNTSNWKVILYEVLYAFDGVTSHYKTKGLLPYNFFSFCMRIYSTMPDDRLTDLLLMMNTANDDTPPPLQFIKNIFFAMPQCPITAQLLNTLERIKAEDESIESMIIDYNNANMIDKSIVLTKQMFNPSQSINVDPNTIIDNFYNVLLAIKFLNNNSQGDDEKDEYDSLFNASSESFPLIKIICDYYQKDPSANKQKASDLLTKLLLFKKSTQIASGLSIYNSILNELRIKKEGIYQLFLSSDFISIILTDLTIKDYESTILDIIFELYTNNDIVIQSDSQIRSLFTLLPSFGSNFKFTSLQSKLDSTLSYEEIMIKYLRCLYSKNENVRYNAINFFIKNEHSGSVNCNEGSINDDSYMKKNYTQFKQVDTLLLIQTATNEYIKVNKAINTGGIGTMEFMPLMNIIHSTKMDYNIKASALEQLVLLSNTNCYKNYYINDIAAFIVKEIKANESNVSNMSMGNYITSLLKLFNMIIIIYFNEERIQSLIKFNAVKDYLHIMINIAVGKDNNTTKHLMAAYAVMFLFIIAFNDKTQQRQNDSSAVSSSSSAVAALMPVLKFFDSYYCINVIPIDMIPLRTSQHSSVLNFSITKNVIDYINYQKKPLFPIFNIREIKENIKQIKTLSLLDIFINITHLLSAYTVYSSITTSNMPSMEINDSLTLILFHFKRIIPKSNEERHLIMDFLNVLDIFLSSNSITALGFDQLATLLPDILNTCLNYTCIDKDFINNLNSENQYFVYELLDFVLRHPIFLPIKRIDLITSFIETYSNVLVFSKEGSYYQLKNNLIKFQSLLINSGLILPEKVYTDIINTICFFLTKYELSGNYLNLNYTIWTLNYLMQVLKMNKGKEILLSKSFVFIKLLGSPFIEVNVLSIQIIGLLLSIEFFDKHGTVITEIYDSIKKLGSHPQRKVIKTNYLSFLIKTIEFVLKNKSIDNEVNRHNEISSDIIIMNQKIFEESELTLLISKAIEADSIESSMVFKYVNACINLDDLTSDRDNSNRHLSKGIFFNWSFYEHINEIIIKETKCIDLISSIDLSKDSILSNTKGINGYISYDNHSLKNKVMINASIESILNVKEGLSLVIKSLSLITQLHFDQYNSVLIEIFTNLIKYNAYISVIWKRWQCDNDINSTSLTKVIQTYALTYFSFLQFAFELSQYDKDFIVNAVINNSLLNPQLFYDICYEMLKLDSDRSEYNFQMKLMFAKVLPYLIELQQEQQSNKANDKAALTIRNEGDTLIEVMTTLKSIYGIKVEIYDSKVNSIFTIENKNIKAKNDIINAISALVLTSQNCKVIFIKSKFINTFIDYIHQLTDALLSEKLAKQNAMEDTTANQEYIAYVINEYVNVLMLMQNLLAHFEQCEERDALFYKEKEGQMVKERFIKMLYEIFVDVIRYTLLFDNYLKLLMNILANTGGQGGGDCSQYFLLPIHKKSKGSNSTLLSLILDYFTKNFNAIASMPSFALFIQFIKCLFRYRVIANSLQKGKFIEAMKSEVNKIVINKKTYGNTSANVKVQSFLEQLMLIFVSLSFDKDYGRKLGNKEFILNLSEVLLKSKNEELIFNIVFFYRNICFVSSNRVAFMANEQLIGSVFALFNGEMTGIKVQYMITHLIWVLLYNNQTLKTMLNREEFKGDLRAMSIHLQKEVDMEKFGGVKQDKDDAIKKDEHKKYLYEACLNMRKIMNILEG